VVAKAMLRGLELYERLTSRLLMSVTAPADDLFYRRPEDLDAFRPGEVLEGGLKGETTRGLHLEHAIVDLARLADQLVCRRRDVRVHVRMMGTQDA
jgi:hypothetical protein